MDPNIGNQDIEGENAFFNEIPSSIHIPIQDQIIDIQNNHPQDEVNPYINQSSSDNSSHAQHQLVDNQQANMQEIRSLNSETKNKSLLNLYNYKSQISMQYSISLLGNNQNEREDNLTSEIKRIQAAFNDPIQAKALDFSQEGLEFKQVINAKRNQEGFKFKENPSQIFIENDQNLMEEQNQINFIQEEKFQQQKEEYQIKDEKQPLDQSMEKQIFEIRNATKEKKLKKKNKNKQKEKDDKKSTMSLNELDIQSLQLLEKLSEILIRKINFFQEGINIEKQIRQETKKLGFVPSKKNLDILLQLTKKKMKGIQDNKSANQDWQDKNR